MDFKSDLLKASLSAVLAAMLLGAATYLLSTQIQTEIPRTVAYLDSYTEKGGLGPIVASNSYFYNQNVTIFANVTDSSGNPIADTTVTFEIHGPPHSNITLVETVKTDSSGLAVLNITAPSTFGDPEKITGVWSAVATTQISDTQIVDSLAFEVTPPPSPFVDVYTDRGGNGPNNSSGIYKPGDTVYLYAEVSNGTAAVADVSVTFTVLDPSNPLYLITAPRTNASGMAMQVFGIRNDPVSLGMWQVTATVRINDQLFSDALIFECKE